MSKITKQELHSDLVELIEKEVEINDTLTSNSTNEALSANQGRVLKDLVDNKVDNNEFNNLKDLVDTKVNENDLNVLKTEVNQYTDGKIAEIVDSAPEALDTLRELAEALGNDPNFTTTILNAIGEKLSKDGGTINGVLNLNAANSRVILPVGKDKYVPK